MKKIILNFEKRKANFKELVQQAFNKDLLNFLISRETSPEFEGIERLTTYSKDKDISFTHVILTDKQELEETSKSMNSKRKIGFYKVLKSKEDEKEIVEISRDPRIDFIIVSAKDWKVIPFENLIAKMQLDETELIAEVENVKEAELMLKTLERGVDGVLMEPRHPNDLIELKKLTQGEFTIELTKARVMKIERIPEADRVCVDTTSLLHFGEGFLVGSTAAGFCLVHSETFDTKFVASRPFRVNAGDVSAYILVPNEEPDKPYRTSYLSELKGGKQVLAVNHEGRVRIVSVGRIKIETRPMLRFELEATKREQKILISCTCQNAETIRFVIPGGKAKSVVDIKIGDEVLAHVGPGATHFGTAIKETIIER
ncbi:MAG: 3-dehydroquinate synthase II [Promethearchaeota archaeon]